MRKRLVTWAVTIAMIASTLMPVIPTYAEEGDVRNGDIVTESLTETETETLETESLSGSEEESSLTETEVLESSEGEEGISETSEELSDESEELTESEEETSETAEVAETTEAETVMEVYADPAVEMIGAANPADGIDKPAKVLDDSLDDGIEVYLGSDILREKSNTEYTPRIIFGSRWWSAIGYRDTGVSYGNQNTLNLLKDIDFDNEDPVKFGNSIEYGKSDIKEQIDIYAEDLLSPFEKAVISKRDLKGGEKNGAGEKYGIAGDDVKDAVLWPLCSEEVWHVYRSVMGNDEFWSCSPGQNKDCIAIGGRNSNPYFYGLKYSDEAYIRPACSIPVSKILFTTKVGMRGYMGRQGLYRLMLYDSNIQLGYKNVDQMLTGDGVQMTIPYTVNIPAGYNADGIMVMVSLIDEKDEAGRKFLYYGELEPDYESIVKETTNGYTKITGTGTVVIPNELDPELVYRSDILLNAVIEGETEGEFEEGLGRYYRYSDMSSEIVRVSSVNITRRANPRVTFDTQGYCTAPKAQEVPLEGYAERPDDPVSDDAKYVFDGWYDNPACYGGEYDFDTPVTKDITLYAKWKRAPLVVKFYKNDGTSNIFCEEEVEYNDKLPEPDSDPERDGYLFDGWYKDQACTYGYKYDFDHSVQNDLNLYAKWLKRYEITFDPVGGSGSMEPEYRYSGEYYTAPECGFTPPAGQRFKEWYYTAKDIYGEDQILTAKPGNQLLVSIKADLVLHAQWMNDTKYTVQFDANGHGTAPQPQTVSSGSTANKPADPTADSYKFVGWYTNKQYGADKLNSYYLFDFSKPVTKETTLYAGWEFIGKIQVTVNYTNCTGFRADVSKREAEKGESITVTLTKESDYFNLRYIQGVPYYNTNFGILSTKTVEPDSFTVSEDGKTYTYTFIIPTQQTENIKIYAYSDPVSEHTHYMERHPGKKPTCTEPGENGYCLCTVCGYKFEYFGKEEGMHYGAEGAHISDEIDFDTWRYIPPTNHHSYPDTTQSTVSHIAAKPANCKEKGYKECYYCSYCKKYYSDAECTHEISDAVIPEDPDAHIFVDTTYYMPQYHFSEDYKHLTASKGCDKGCGACLTETVDVVVNSYTAPTCTTSGSISYKLKPFYNPMFESYSTKPGKESEELPALGHDYRTEYYWDTESDPYKVTGTVICSRCHDKLAEETVSVTSEKAERYTKLTAAFTDEHLADKTRNIAEISFDLNGVEGTAPKKQIVFTGDTAQIPEEPSADGLVFYGWYTEAACYADSGFDFGRGVTEDTILYAKWGAPAFFRVEFDLNGHGEPIDPVAVNKGNTIIPPEDPTAGGYTFAGWFIDKALTIPYVFGAEVTSDLTLHAKWISAAKETVSVSFDMGGYGSTIPERIIQKGQKVTQPDDPIDSEKVFVGWFVDDTFASKFDFKKAVNSNITIYAKWEEKDPDGFFAYFDIKKDTLTYNSGLNRYEHVYTTGKITPLIVVEDFGGRKLKEGTDYTIKYTNNVNVDKKGKPAVAKITGKGNYKGSKKLLFYVTPKSIGSGSDATPSEDILLYDITVKSGSKVAPILYYNGYKLAAKNYTLVSKTGSLKITDADDVSNLKLTITGKGNFSGSIKEADITRLSKQEIAAKTINKVTIKPGVTFTYNGKYQGPTAEQLKVMAGNVVVEPENYEIKYSNNKNAGAAKVIVSGINGYAGSVVKTYKIVPDKSVSVMTVTADAEVTYVKGGAKPAIKVTAKAGEDEVTLKEGRDYKVTYNGNTRVNAAASYTVSFLGNYKGQSAKKGVFAVKAAPFNTEHVSVKASDLIYGKPGKYLSKLYVTYDGVILTGKEYTATYKIGEEDITKRKNYTLTGDSVKVNVILKGKGNYADTEIPVNDCYSIKIKPANAIDLSKAKISMKGNPRKGIPAQSYTGYEIRPDFDVYIKVEKDWVTASEAGLVAGVDYDITYMNNTARGKGTVLVRARDASEKAVNSKSATFTIGQRTLSLLLQLFR